jgi:GNAT superfamily N-acetyltransferase
MSHKMIVKEIKKINSGIDSLVNIIYKNFKYLSSDPKLGHTHNEIKRLLKNNDMLSLFVYNQNGKLIAYLIGEFKTLNDGRYVYYISYLYVAKPYRSRKIGAQLMKLIISKCNNIGVKHIILTCDTHDRKVLTF